MKAFWLGTKTSLLKSLPPRVRWGKWKWNALKKYFYVHQGFSGERCGPWACYIFVIISSFKRIWPFIWRNSFKDNLYQVWLNLVSWFWRRFLKNFQCIFTLSLLSPLQEGLSPSFEQTWIPSPKDDLCQVCLKLAQWFWRRSWKCKSLQTDVGQQAIRKAHLRFQLRWAKHFNLGYIFWTKCVLGLWYLRYMYRCKVNLRDLSVPKLLILNFDLGLKNFYLGYICIKETFLLVPRLLTLNFDLVLKNFNLSYIFWTKYVRTLILEI
jgi:hypothetical protein